MDSDPPPDFSVPLVPALSEAETIASQILGGSLALSCKSVERLADLLLAEAPVFIPRWFLLMALLPWPIAMWLMPPCRI